ncbi:alternative ribosome rescue aminoacyl-tRNA hydrolase ArfB [Tomitella fengzijianii]|uniref:Aminoacyl-tRNA hydrolase n=1 Tax=Tomitella fengzijianii TaxID=2597660 RepID=A0A516X488_9ACTN|nr:alternative ribosome rescue aminoacyl-tRNA hydrolase ArfB [Tomitella fengzijianii]QDQ97813.1 aminoacyl-tRNA hydrolase [Tomitella fengzijianii]
MDTTGAHEEPGGPGTPGVAGPLAVTASVIVPPAALHWRFSRAHGPGGQGVNTTDSRVELVVRLDAAGMTGPQLDRVRTALAHRLADDALVVVASEHRSQLRNRQAARDRATALLRQALTAPPPRTRKRRRPSRAAKQRRLDAKKRRGQTKSLRRRPDH